MTVWEMIRAVTLHSQGRVYANGQVPIPVEFEVITDMETSDFKDSWSTLGSGREYKVVPINTPKPIKFLNSDTLYIRCSSGWPRTNDAAIEDAIKIATVLAVRVYVELEGHYFLVNPRQSVEENRKNWDIERTAGYRE